MRPRSPICINCIELPAEAGTISTPLITVRARTWATSGNVKWVYSPRRSSTGTKGHCASFLPHQLAGQPPKKQRAQSTCPDLHGDVSRRERHTTQGNKSFNIPGCAPAKQIACHPGFSGAVPRWQKSPCSECHMNKHYDERRSGSYGLQPASLPLW